MLSRRSLLQGISGAVAGTALGSSDVIPAAASEPAPAQTQADGAFSFDVLTSRMREAAGKAYKAPSITLPKPIQKLTYDQYKAIAFRPERALWADINAQFRLEAFHMGWLFKEPVRLFEVVDGMAMPIIFTDEDFEYRPPLKAEDFKDLKMPGVAGFRIYFPLNRPDVFDELIVFQGASYFRALGHGNNYGISARGLAIDTATSKDEEFPSFTEFYIERPTPTATKIRIYAALEGPSVTGAYAFNVIPGEDTVTDISARLFFRSDINRLGIAPLNSMFLFGENNRYVFDDYRAQVHDSDGLQIVSQEGAQLWRTLNNPSVLANSFFSNSSVASFALLQRQRGFADYEDAEAHYERRPSLRVQPSGDWGKGNVQLVEIPSDLEQNDNIVSFWIPDQPAKAGQSMEVAYRLSWGDLKAEPSVLARAVGTRTGVGGPSGIKNEAGLRKFVVDFSGGMLSSVAGDAKVAAKTSVGGGDVVGSSIERIDSKGIWRVSFDVRPGGDAPLEMSSYLVLAERPISETWHYQWRPGDEKRRV